MTPSERSSTWRHLAVEARRVYKSLNIHQVRYSPLEWRRHGETDVYMLWFPKTGGTWVRLLLHHALSMHTGIRSEVPLDFGAFRRADVPVLRPHNDDEPHWKRPDQLERSKVKYRDKKVVLLVRDPRDTIVSLYFQKTKRWRTYDRTLHEFVWEPSGSFATMLAFYDIWAAERHVPAGFHLVRYEDLHRSPRDGLRAMLDFAGLGGVSDDVVDRSVAASSFATMKKREAALEFRTSRLRPGDPGDPDSFKARRGEVGGFGDYLDPDDVRQMTDRIVREFDPLYGYGARVS